MMSQCRDHHDIIIYPLINKEFLFKKFSYQLTPISFCLLGRNTYSSIFTGVCQIPTFFFSKILSQLSSFSTCPTDKDKAVIITSDNNNNNKKFRMLDREG